MRGQQRDHWLVAAAAAALVLITGCSSTALRPAPPVNAEASEAMADGYRLYRSPAFADVDPGTRLKLQGHLSRAREAAPEWPAPARLADEVFLRSGLLLPARYGDYVQRGERSASRELRAAALYLAGRLGGKDADARLTRAAELDPSLSWARHGLAWRMARTGDRAEALEVGALALSLARSPHEVVHFASALAQYAMDGRDQQLYRRAIELVGPTLSPGAKFPLSASLRAEVEVDLALLEMGAGISDHQRRGVHRAIGRLQGPGITTSERLQLAAELLDSQQALITREQIIHALMDARRGAESEVGVRQIEELIGYAVGDDDVVSEPGADRLLGIWRPRLEQAFADGNAPEIFGRWAAELPATVLDGNGRPRRRDLARLDQAVREAAEAGVDTPAQVVAMGEALIAAGWFREAFALARRARKLGHGCAADLEWRASQGRAALARVANIARRIDLEMAFERSGAVGSDGVTSAEGDQIDSLRSLGSEVRRILGTSAEDDSPAVLSPKVRYGPLGAVLHPGPAFSHEDERLGRGSRGESVPGIAALFRSLGRFALLGNGVGQGGPDAAVLRLVHDEWREGEHLGRPFRGHVFWCEGADVPGRFARRGASISGAALHEGYFVDLAQVQRERAQWDNVRGRFEDPGRVQLALDVRGAQVPKALRAESTPALGASDRMRLAVMAEGASTGSEGLVLPSLGDFAHVVETHEEGHLCDRARWYPITLRRLYRVIVFAGAHGFSAVGLAKALEARAQLVAMASVRDPRFALIDLLDAAESGRSGGITPHGDAYRGLLDDLLERMDQEVEQGDWDSRGIDPGRRLIDQLHRVDPEHLRGLAIREARARGLTGD